MRRRMLILIVAALTVAAMSALASPAAGGPQRPGDPPFDLPIEVPGSEDVDQVIEDLGSLLGGQDVQAGAQAAGEELRGLFRIEPGECGTGGVTSGSWFRMVQPLGTPAQGPYLPNTDSPCGDITVTPLRPGTDGGLRTTGHQPHPDPAFAGLGDGANDRITLPQAFFGTRFSTATNPTDPQTGAQVPVPVITHDGNGSLSGDLRAFAAAWNGQHFNQGAPKPDGTLPGGTFGPQGTFDPDTGRYSITWGSHIVGGPFNAFGGLWHLEGTFEPAAQEPTGPAAQPDAAQAPQTADPAAGQQQPQADPGTGPVLAETGPPVTLVLPLGLLGLAGWLGAFLRRHR